MGENAVYLVHLVFGGDEPQRPLAIGQVIARAVAIYIAGIAIVRIGKSRLISRTTPVDVLMGFILGSLLSRGINGSASMSGTIAACATLAAMHWLLTLIAFYHHGFGSLIKGHAYLLVKDGVLQWENLKRAHVTEHDLVEELRLNANLEDPAQVKAAYKERSGGIGIVPKEKESQ